MEGKQGTFFLQCMWRTKRGSHWTESQNDPLPHNVSNYLHLLAIINTPKILSVDLKDSISRLADGFPRLHCAHFQTGRRN